MSGMYGPADERESIATIYRAENLLTFFQQSAGRGGVRDDLEKLSASRPREHRQNVGAMSHSLASAGGEFSRRPTGRAHGV